MAHPYGVYAELRQQAPVSFFEPTGQWLIARHVAFGKTPDAARAWVMRSDQANAAVVAATRDRADVIVRVAL